MLHPIYETVHTICVKCLAVLLNSVRVGSQHLKHVVYHCVNKIMQCFANIFVKLNACVTGNPTNPLQKPGSELFSAFSKPNILYSQSTIKR